MSIKYPNIKVKLTGTDGNAFAILGKVKAAMAKKKIPSTEIQAFMKEAMSGDYNHLLATACDYVVVS